MPSKRLKAEQINPKLREAEVELAKGRTVVQVVKHLGMTEQTYYRWRKEYGGLRVDQAKRLKELEKENARLKKLLAEAELDKAYLTYALTQKALLNVDVLPALEPLRRKLLLDDLIMDRMAALRADATDISQANVKAAENYKAQRAGWARAEKEGAVARPAACSRVSPCVPDAASWALAQGCVHTPPSNRSADRRRCLWDGWKREITMRLFGGKGRASYHPSALYARAHPAAMLSSIPCACA